MSLRTRVSPSTAGLPDLREWAPRKYPELRGPVEAFGPNVPPRLEAAEARAQMTPVSPFSPGTPIGPWDGFDRTPRSPPGRGPTSACRSRP